MRATPPPSHPPNVQGPPKGRKGRERERKEREFLQSQREDTSTRAGSTTAADIQCHADKLLLQASEIGLRVLRRASAFWKEKEKEKVVKVIEERSGGAGTSSGVGIEERGRGKNVDGRPRVMEGKPKWMKEVVSDEDEGDEFGQEGFEDGAQKRIDIAHHETVDLFSFDPIPTRPVSQQRPPLS